MDIISQMNERIPSLRSSEQKVANWILLNIQQASLLSITELAEANDVSEATITRLAKGVACKNVRELKLKLAQASAVGQRFVHDTTEKTSHSGVFESIKETLDLNLRLLDDEKIEQAIDAFLHSKQIITIGMGGSSTIAAQEMQFRLFRLGYPSTAYHDGVLSKMIASVLDTKDCMVLFSASGYVTETLSAGQIAKDTGATIIAITPEKTPIAELADIHLPIAHNEGEFIFKPSSIRYAMLAIMDVVVMELSLRSKKKSREKLRKLKSALDKHRDGGDRLPLGD
ncbi:MurR/RpiR family transcriptional regulator [Vibrio sp.]|nr:MurR/RpiR family transcriptional regulator [Vibrio sp.]